MSNAGTTDTGNSSTSTLTKQITVSLVNDYEIILRGLHSMLSPFSDRIRIVEHEVGGTPDVRADIALFDTFAGRRDSLDRARQMAEERLVEHIVMYTWDAAPEFISIARSNGVDAVILKSTAGEQLADQLLQVAAGRKVGLDDAVRSRRKGPGDSLSLREQEVLALLALGYSNPEIANELFLSVDTVKTYVRRVFAKLGVNNRTNAALLAARYDLAPPARRMSHEPGGAEPLR